MRLYTGIAVAVTEEYGMTGEIDREKNDSKTNNLSGP
jgi:hypothetical protein